MRVSSWLLPTELLLLVGSLRIFPGLVGAAPSVNIGLKASFGSAPYLVELLETAAEENESTYFRILDRIADGYFRNTASDKELYDKFLEILQEDDLITDADSLSSFKLALSIHNAAPRIEAHYQYYKTSIEPLLEKSGARQCDTWLEFASKQFCSPQLEKEDSIIHDLGSAGSSALPFDRYTGSDGALPATLYADILSPDFGKFHTLVKNAAKEGKVNYRVRHVPPKSQRHPLRMSGFGAELALKKTDYIVIDDRDKEEKGFAKKDDKVPEQDLDADEDVADLTPLSSSDLESLSMKTAGYIMNSEYPLKRLLKVTQDFPKYSSFLASQDVSLPFKKEHTGNRELFLPAGFSVVWINGVQYDPRKMDAYSLLDHMRRERKLIASFKELGFTNGQAIQLLTHPAIAENQQNAESTRYDWRDANEGGNVIIWLNDIEKDARYEEWPSNLMAYMQRTYPGQLPMVKRDLHNVILPVDFSDPRSVQPVVETVQDFVKRKIPVRFGLVPLAHTESAERQAKVAYHIHDAYGLSALVQYLETALSGKKLSVPDDAVFQGSIGERKLKAGAESLSLQQILDGESSDESMNKARMYLTRLGVAHESPPLFVNGVPVKNDDEWLQAFSQRISLDMRDVQKAIWESSLDEEIWLPGRFLEKASLRRNPLIIPENEKQIQLISLVKAFEGHNAKLIEKLPKIRAATNSAPVDSIQLLVVADLSTEAGLRLLLEAISFREQQSDIELVILDSTGSAESPLAYASDNEIWDEANLHVLQQRLTSLLNNEEDAMATLSAPLNERTPIIRALGFDEGQLGVVINGRKVGPIPVEATFTRDDFETLYDFELKRRITPARGAIADLAFGDRVQSALDNAKLFSILAISTISDMPEGIFELPPPIRTRLFYDWNTTNTAITVGDNSTAVIQIIAAIDPASEAAQQWVPIIKALSELNGVYLRLFLNPKEKLQELPVKRFYRYALDTEPNFDASGAANSPGITFEGIPKNALVTAGMNVPPSWLVAPSDTVQDLDNIKLSSLGPGANVDATYELENILIEGHSRDVTTGIAPRGAQLALSTAKDKHFADTLIMANLGYFQFKANPGYYNISLLPGLSQKIFNIDSVGALGYDSHAGDESTEVTLMSFSGVTLYPRLSRKPGMEQEDVLGTPQPSVTDTAADLAAIGADMVDSLLAKAGFKQPQAGKYLAGALEGARKYFLKTVANVTPVGEVTTAMPAHAEINIFSVASGHLYERMLNIMMVSVMKHTNHTVKFWFIEQFLSSSFKTFLPTLAKEYGFQYEMVTYKWPHWLRAQKEKQREIWGYKILFLDVLFPLDLDKVIFVDADQIVRTDMMELVNIDLKGAPYGFVPMGDSRTEMEGFRFWKQGYWKNFLRGLPYHISALYVVDLKRFRQIAAGDRLRQQYHQLSADPGSLSNLDQDLPNNMQMSIPIHTLPQEWLWCETWCSDEDLATAKTIDLCNNPMTKEPKLDRARRQVPEWTVYDDEIAALAKRTKGELPKGDEQERLQKDEEAKEGKKKVDSPEHNEL